MPSPITGSHRAPTVQRFVMLYGMCSSPRHDKASGQLASSIQAFTRHNGETVMDANKYSTKIHNPIEKALQNPKSLRAAINAECFDCQGQDSDPAPKWRIGNCEISDCPLYTLRPYQDNLSRPIPNVLRHNGEQERSGDDQGITA